MTSNVIEALRHLASSFTVKDIMTPKARLVCASDFAAAPAISAANSDFSIIPIRKGDELAAYFDRDSGQAQPIEIGDLVSDGTTLLDLVDILQRRGFSFVLTHQSIDGYVHYSDLNHQMVKWTFYVMLEAVERLAIENIRPVDERAYLRERMSSDLEQIQDAYKRAGDNGRNLMTYLNLADVLRLAVRDGVFQLDENSIKTMKDSELPMFFTTSAPKALCRTSQPSRGNACFFSAVPAEQRVPQPQRSQRIFSSRLARVGTASGFQC